MSVFRGLHHVLFVERSERKERKKSVESQLLWRSRIQIP